MFESAPSHIHNNTSNPAVELSAPFPFLKLPPELRQNVYKFILIQDKQPLRPIKRPKLYPEPRKPASAILAANRQVYLEAHPIFLSGNEFLLRGTATDHSWLKALGSKGLKDLRKITYVKRLKYDWFNFQDWNSYRTFSLLAKCPRLSLTIIAHCHQISLLKEQRVFEYLHGFSSATVKKKTARSIQDCGRRHWSDNRLVRPGKEDEQVELLLEQFRSTCRRSCRMHKEIRDRAGYRGATVHFDCDYGCYGCWKDHARSIYGME